VAAEPIANRKVSGRSGRSVSTNQIDPPARGEVIKKVHGRELARKAPADRGSSSSNSGACNSHEEIRKGKAVGQVPLGKVARC
jgi:hypothetical protein